MSRNSSVRKLASYVLNNGGLIPGFSLGVKLLEHETEDSPSCTAEGKNAWSFTSTALTI
jgi:hypothetical protein